jgi:hypothetical protein
MAKTTASLPVVVLGMVLTFLISGTAQTTQKQQTAKGSAKSAVKAAPPTVRLDLVAKVIGDLWPTKNNWSLTVQYHKEGYPPKGADVATADIDKIIDLRRKARAAKENRPDIIDEWDLIEKYREDIAGLLSVSGPLLYTGLPVGFALKDNELTLILESLGSTNVYNTLRLDAKQRAAKEIQDTVLPAIKRFAVVKSTDIKNFGVVVVYGSKDFSDESDVLNTKAEIVALVASSERCKKLAAAELTEEEFVDTADVYIIDRDTIKDVRKIKASIGEKGR